jgi:DNA-binding NarL/FixJ family response regulator/predicted ATPase
VSAVGIARSQRNDSQSNGTGAVEPPALRARFVGRQAEIAAFRAALVDALAGTTQVVDVTGEPGIGKTRLIGEFARIAAEEGLQVLTGQASESDRPVPLASLLDVLDDPYGPPPGIELPGGAAGIHHLHRTVRGLLERLATERGARGLALLLDDVHLADETTVKLLAQLVRRPPQAPVLLVVAYRQRQAPVRLHAAISDAGPAVRRVPLVPLTAEDVTALLGSYGTRSWQRALHRESGGNPLYLDALVRTWLDTADRRTRQLSPSARVGLIREVEAASPLGRLVIDAAAVVGEAFEPGIVAELTDRGQAEVLGALDELVELDLIRPVADERRFAFRHGLIRQAVYATISPGWRLAAHTRAIEVLQRQGASAVALARHVEQAAVAGDMAAVSVLRKAASAVATQAPMTSARWLRTALRLLPDHTEQDRRRVVLLVRLAQALGHAGRLRESRDTIHEALRMLPRSAAVPRARAVAFCAMIERLLCRRVEAEAMLRMELGTLPAENTLARSILLFELACSEFAAGRHKVCVQLAGQALAIPRPHQHGIRSARASTLALMAIANAAMADTTTARTQLDQASTLLDSMLDGEFLRSLAAALWVIWGEVLLERWDDALRHLNRAIAFARRNNQTLALPHLYVKRVLVLRAQGRLIEAKEVAEDAVDLAFACGGGEQVTSALMMRCWVDVLCGDVADGLRNGTAATDRSPSDWSNMLANRMLAEARLAAGDPAGCLALAAMAGGPDLPLAEMCSRAAWYEILTRAALALGRVDEAADWADRAEAVASRLNLPGRTGLTLLARAQVLVVQRPAEALAVATEAADTLDSAGAVFDATRARVVAALAKAALGRVDEAAAELRTAQAAYESFGANGLARQTMIERRRLAARGARRSPAADPAGVGVGNLTRRQQQVAGLVREGLTNRRIAQELFVSEKTVEMHLANIFVRLGVSSRVALARMVSEAS